MIEDVRFSDILDEVIEKTDVPWLGKHGHDFAKYPQTSPLAGGHPGDHAPNPDFPNFDLPKAPTPGMTGTPGAVDIGALQTKRLKLIDQMVVAQHQQTTEGDARSDDLNRQIDEIDTQIADLEKQTIVDTQPTIPRNAGWDQAVKAQFPGGVAMRKPPETVTIATSAIAAAIKTPDGFKRVSIMPTNMIETHGIEAQYLPMFNTINFDKELDQSPKAPIVLIHEMGHALEASFMHTQGVAILDQSILDSAEFADIKAGIEAQLGTLKNPYEKKEAWADAFAQYVANKAGLDQALAAYEPAYDQNQFHTTIEPAMDRMFAARDMLGTIALMNVEKRAKEEAALKEKNAGALSGTKRAFDAVPLPMIVQHEDKSQRINPLESDNYIFQKKYDGHRALIRIENGKVTEIRSRTGEDYTAVYPELQDLPGKMKLGKTGEYIFDGEIVVFDDNGISNIELLQNKRKKKDAETRNASFVAFDVLAADGEDTTHMDLEQRLNLLTDVLPVDDPLVQKAPTYLDGKSLFEEFQGEAGEGIVAKLRASTYETGTRSDSWLKLKYRKEAEVIIGGYEVLPSTWSKGKLREGGRAKYDNPGDVHNGDLATVIKTPKGWNPDSPSPERIDERMQKIPWGDFRIRFDDGTEIPVTMDSIVPPQAGLVGAVRLGVFDENGQFRYVGDGGAGLLRLGGGFPQPTKDLLDGSISPDNPFADGEKVNKNSVWLRPETIITVDFQDLTSNGLLRQPKIVGQRTDKNAAEVTMRQLIAGATPAKAGPKNYEDLSLGDQAAWNALLIDPHDTGQYDDNGPTARAWTSYVTESETINDSLRAGETPPYHDDAQMSGADIVDTLDTYTQSQEAPVDVMIYRGIGSEVNVQPGDVINDKAFTSWTLDRSMALSFASTILDRKTTVLRMKMEKGSEFGPGHPDLKELVLSRDGNWRVVSVDFSNASGTTFITVEPVRTEVPKGPDLPPLEDMTFIKAIDSNGTIIPVKFIENTGTGQVVVQDRAGKNYTIGRDNMLNLDTAYGQEIAKDQRARLSQLFAERRSSWSNTVNPTPEQEAAHSNFMAKLGERIGELTAYLKAQPGGFRGKTDVPWVGKHAHDFVKFPMISPTQGGHPGAHQVPGGYALEQGTKRFVQQSMSPDTLEFGSWTPDPSNPQDRGTPQFHALDELYVQAIQGLPPLDTRRGWNAWVGDTRGNQKSEMYRVLTGEESDKAKVESVSKLIESLDDSFRQASPWPKDTIVYRPTTINANMQGMNEGDQFRVTNFVETQLFRRNATAKVPNKENVIFRIQVPKGSKALFLNEFAGEILLPRNSEFKLLKKHAPSDAGTFWDVEIVDQPVDEAPRFRDLSVLPKKEQSNVLRREAGMSEVPSGVSDYAGYPLDFANDKQKQALQSYASQAYEQLNSLARGTLPDAVGDRKIMQENINVLETYTRSGTLTEPTLLYRGIAEGRFLDEIGVGGTLAEPGFLSTSTDRKTAASTFSGVISTDIEKGVVTHRNKPALLVIEAPDGTKYGPGHPGELEAILPRGAQLELLEKLPDTYDPFSQRRLDLWRARLKQSAPDVVQQAVIGSQMVEAGQSPKVDNLAEYDKNKAQDQWKSDWPYGFIKYLREIQLPGSSQRYKIVKQKNGKYGVFDSAGMPEDGAVKTSKNIDEVQRWVQDNKGPDALDQSWVDSLTAEETHSLLAYQTAGYSGINGDLRHPREQMNSRGQEMIQYVTSAIEKSRIPERMTLYRRGDVPADIAVGDAFIDKGFSSTASNKKVLEGARIGGNSMMVIDAPAGTQAAHIDDATGNVQGWDEWTLQRGTEFRIDSIEEGPYGIRTIHVTIVGQNQK